jgi:hypothetical protein
MEKVKADLVEQQGYAKYDPRDSMQPFVLHFSKLIPNRKSYIVNCTFPHVRS